MFFASFQKFTSPTMHLHQCDTFDSRNTIETFDNRMSTNKNKHRRQSSNFLKKKNQNLSVIPVK